MTRKADAEYIEYKYITEDFNGNITWEDNHNRKLDLTTLWSKVKGSEQVVHVTDEGFNVRNNDAEKIISEEKHAEESKDTRKKSNYDQHEVKHKVDNSSIELLNNSSVQFIVCSYKRGEKPLEHYICTI